MGDSWIDSSEALKLVLPQLSAKGVKETDLAFELAYDWQNGACWRISAYKVEDRLRTSFEAMVPAFGEGQARVSINRYDRSGMPVKVD